MIEYPVIPPLKSVKGFTLVELSIVIVIIGLIIAGVTAGSSLVRQSQLQHVLVEKNNFIQAIISFKLQYNAFPGDITNASSYWSTCTAPKCNGNGDGAIGYPITNGADGIEALRMWQHLNLAQLLPGNYTGVAVSSFETIIGINAPDSAMPKLGWSVRGNGDGTISIPQLNYMFATYGKGKSILALGGIRSANDYAPDGSGITPQQAYSLEKKIDDGLPNKGIMFGGRALDYGGYECISPGLAYILTTTTKSCTIGFPIPM